MRNVLPNNDITENNVASDGSSTSSIVSRGSALSVSEVQAETNTFERERAETTNPTSSGSLFYLFCLLVCFTGFIALLIRRLGST
jgi:hypothetical protein